MPFYLSLFRKKKEKSPTFPLSKLPFLAIEEIIKFMDSLDLMKLSAISMKMSNIVLLTKPRMKKFQIEFAELVSKIGISYEFFEVHGNVEKKWFKKTVISSVPNTIISLERIQNAFSKTEFSLTLKPSQISVENVKNVLAICQSEYCRKVTVIGGGLMKEELDVLMEMREREDKEINLDKADFPVNYWHQNVRVRFLRVRPNIDYVHYHYNNFWVLNR